MVDAFREQSEADMDSFLRLRAREFAPGGLLLVVEDAAVLKWLCSHPLVRDGGWEPDERACWPGDGGNGAEVGLRGGAAARLRNPDTGRPAQPPPEPTRD